VPLARRVLILGGGDGLAVREVLKHAQVQRVDLVDLDPAMTRLFTEHSLLSSLNGGVLSDARVQVHNQDAARFLEDTAETWDAIIIDLPDPSSPALARLYASSFYALLERRLSAEGARDLARSRAAGFDVRREPDAEAERDENDTD